MSKARSPNFPVIDLESAIQAVGKIYAKEGRTKFPQLSAATHLGYTTINGRSLGMFAALRAYGLIEGRGDHLIVTPDAVALIEAPPESADRVAALTRAFSGPSMFNRIQEEYPEPPSEQTLRWWLIQQGFTPDGAEKAADIFLESRKLVTLLPKVYNEDATPPGSGDKAKTAFGRPVADMFSDFFSPPGAGKQNDPPSPKGQGEQESIAMGVQERILQSGMLSKTASYRVIVSGHVGETEIDRLLKKIEMDKEILADQTHAMPEGYSDHDADGYNG